MGAGQRGITGNWSPELALRPSKRKDRRGPLTRHDRSTLLKSSLPPRASVALRRRRRFLLLVACAWRSALASSAGAGLGGDGRGSSEGSRPVIFFVGGGGGGVGSQQQAIDSSRKWLAAALSGRSVTMSCNARTSRHDQLGRRTKWRVS